MSSAILLAAKKQHAAGDLGAAAKTYRTLLDAAPQLSAAALHGLGTIALQLGQIDKALSILASAKTLADDLADAENNLLADILGDMGVAYLQKGNVAAALEQLLLATATAPQSARHHDNLGLALNANGQADAAKAAFHKALSCDPHYGLAHLHLGAEALAQNNFEQAQSHCAAASRLLPKHALAQAQYAELWRQAGFLDHAQSLFLRAHQLAPQDAQIAYSLACNSYCIGNQALAAQHFDARLRLPVYTQQRQQLPRLWQGEMVDTLLVEAEQGLGDSLQYLRFVPALKKYAKNIILRVQKPLWPLLAGHNLADPAAPPPTHDAAVFILSLPHLLKIDPANSAQHNPYLTAPALPATLATIFYGTGLKAGLVWAGNPQHRNDHNRSLKLAQLQPLFSLPHWQWFSLQKGVAETELAAFNAITDLAPHLTDFAVTAAVINALDVVVTVDTAVAHLAGALGKPCLVFLPLAVDWRWQLDREDSPWYPSLCLMRQSAPQQWHSAIQNAASKLSAFAAGDKQALVAQKWQKPPALRSAYAVKLTVDFVADAP